MPDPTSDLPPGKKDEPRGPHTVSSHLSRWLRRPQVLADPEQVESGRIWTRARDVLPGTYIRSDRPLLAVWGRAAFEARPEWDDTELGTLWLHKTSDLSVPRPEVAYRTPAAPEGDASTAAVSDTGPPRARGRPRGPSPAGEPESAADHLAAVVEDFDECLVLLLSDREDIRNVLRRLVRGVAELPPAAREALEGLPAWQEVIGLCHLPTPPWLPPQEPIAG